MSRFQLSDGLRSAARSEDETIVGVNDASYWHRYFWARHDVSFYMGVVSVCAALIFTLTGRCPVKNRGIVLRSQDPKQFWEGVAIFYGIGLISLALYVYTGS